MKNSYQLLAHKQVIILSDYVPLSQYSTQELKNEKQLITQIITGVKQHALNCHYIEVKNLSQVQTKLLPYPPASTIIFNWCEDFTNQPGSAVTVAHFLENNKYIFTGATSQSLTLNQDKFKVNQLLKRHHLPVPHYQLIHHPLKLKFPIILKLANQHSSVGLSSKNVITHSKLLNPAVKHLQASFLNQPIIAQEYINGPEYAVPIWGNPNSAQIMPISRIRFNSTNRFPIQTESSKFNPNSTDYKNITAQLLSPQQHQALSNQISPHMLSAYRLLKLGQYARFDIRYNRHQKQAYIIDVNANPALELNNSLFQAAHRLGYNPAQFILQILSLTLLATQKTT